MTSCRQTDRLFHLLLAFFGSKDLVDHRDTERQGLTTSLHTEDTDSVIMRETQTGYSVPRMNAVNTGGSCT